MNFLKNTLIGTSLLLILIVVILGNMGTTYGPPNNAIVYVDDARRIYYAEPCATDDVFFESKFTLRQTIYEKLDLNYSPASKCRHAGWLTQNGRSQLGLLFEKIGLIGPMESRWNEDGSWRY